MDWLTTIPYLLLSFVLLICIGVYALLTGKQFLHIIFGVVILFAAVNLLLLTLANIQASSGGVSLDPLTQVFSIFIISVGFVLFILGLVLERRLRQTGATTIMEFNFELEEGSPTCEQAIISQPNIFIQESSSQKEGSDK